MRLSTFDGPSEGRRLLLRSLISLCMFGSFDQRGQMAKSFRRLLRRDMGIKLLTVSFSFKSMENFLALYVEWHVKIVP